MANPTQAALTALFGNGPVLAGLATGVDKFSALTDGISVDATLEGTCARTFDRFPVGKLPGARAVLQACIALTVHRPNLCVNGLRGRPSPAGHISTANWSASLPPPDESIISLAVTMVTAMKVTWWMTNHHTGQGAPQGYFAKWIGINETYLGLSLATDADRAYVISCMWRVGHFFDTRVILAGCGINGLAVNPALIAEAKATFEVAPDLLLRVQSNPAGTAKVCDCAAAVLLLAGTAYSSVVPYTPAYRQLLVERERIRRNPAQFHEGAMYLTGTARSAVLQVDEQVIDTLGTFMNVTRPTHTLTRAKCFANVSNNKALEARLKALTLALTQQKVTDKDLKKGVKNSAAWPKDIFAGDEAESDSGDDGDEHDVEVPDA